MDQSPRLKLLQEGHGVEEADLPARYELRTVQGKLVQKERSNNSVASTPSNFLPPTSIFGLAW